LTNVTQMRNSTGVLINPAKLENQFQQDTHWQTRVGTADATIKAEQAGKVVVLTDILAFGTVASGQFYIRQGDVTGTIIAYIVINFVKDTMFSHSFREGLEGAAYDGSGGGNLFFDQLTANVHATFTGYMREA